MRETDKEQRKGKEGNDLYTRNYVSLFAIFFTSHAHKTIMR